jgi:hypothetical protein
MDTKRTSYRVVIDMTVYQDGSKVLKIGDRGSRIGADFRNDRKFFNPTESMLDKLFKVPHTVVSSSRGEAGWYQLWSLK